MLDVDSFHELSSLTLQAMTKYLTAPIQTGKTSHHKIIIVCWIEEITQWAPWLKQSCALLRIPFYPMLAE
jgi:hypothetical protein